MPDLVAGRDIRAQTCVAQRCWKALPRSVAVSALISATKAERTRIVGGNRSCPHRGELHLVHGWSGPA